METTHSKTGRTKSAPSKIVIHSWDEVWASFKDENNKPSIEEMETDGWKTIERVFRETGLSKSTIRDLASNGKMEKTKIKVVFNGCAREMTFVRPKTTTCQ